MSILDHMIYSTYVSYILGMFSLYGLTCYKQFFCMLEPDDDCTDQPQMPQMPNDDDYSELSDDCPDQPHMPPIKRNMRIKKCMHSTPVLSRVTMPTPKSKSKSQFSRNKRKTLKRNKRIKTALSCLRTLEANANTDTTEEESIYSWCKPKIFTLRNETVVKPHTNDDIVWILNPLVSQKILDSHFKQPESIINEPEIHNFVDDLCTKVTNNTLLANQLLDDIIKTSLIRDRARRTIATWITNKQNIRRASKTIATWIINKQNVRKQERAIILLTTWIAIGQNVRRARASKTIATWIAIRYHVRKQAIASRTIATWIANRCHVRKQERAGNTIATWITNRCHVRKQERARARARASNTIAAWIANMCHVRKQERASKTIATWITNRYHVRKQERASNTIATWITNRYHVRKQEKARASRTISTWIANRYHSRKQEESKNIVNDWLVVG